MTIDAWLVVALIVQCAVSVGAVAGLVLGTWFARRHRLDNAALRGPQALARQIREELARRTDRG